MNTVASKIILLLILLGSTRSVAQSDTITPVSLYNLSLEELLNLEVKVASKKAEKISDAPGMITSYTASDIERFGYYTLKDLSNITSGYSSFSAFGETNIETRGQKAGSWNASKHLLMIDGIPVNHSRANSAPMEYQVPLFFADKVEFLKGPGSALYGTSAFYGAMSIHSKKLQEIGALTETKISYGDAGKSKRVMTNAILKNKIGATNVSFSYFKKGFSGDPLGVNDSTKHLNNDNSLFFNSSFKFTSTPLKGLSFGVIYMRRSSHGGEFWSANPNPNNTVTWEQYIPYAKYEKEFSDRLSFNSYIKHNGSSERSTYGIPSSTFVPGYTVLQGYDYTTANIEGLAEFTYKLNDHSDVITGISYDSRQELSNPTSYEWNTSAPVDTTKSYAYTFNSADYNGSTRVNVASAYVQYRNELNLLKGLVLTAGGRLDNGFSEAGTYTQFSPRLALVQKLTNNLNLKAMYGQALRVPGVKELGTNAEAISDIKINGGTGDPNNIPDIGAEVIKSSEASINYNNKKISATLVYFYNITTNALDGDQYDYIDQNNQNLTANFFSNTSGKIIGSGFEIDLQYAPNQYLRFMVNHAYAKAIINDTTNFVDVPIQKSNIAITGIFPSKFKLASTLVLRKNWGYTVKENTYNKNDVEMDNSTTLTGFTMIDLNFQIPITKHFGVEFQLRNLLDTKWKQPSLKGQNSMIPLARRNCVLTINGRF